MLTDIISRNKAALEQHFDNPLWDENEQRAAATEVPDAPVEEPLEEVPDSETPPRTNEEEEDTDFVDQVSVVEETEHVAGDDASTSLGIASGVVKEEANNLDSFVKDAAAVETYAVIIRKHGLTPGMGEVIRTALESIHPSFGGKRVVPSLEALEEGENGIENATVRSLDQAATQIADVTAESLQLIRGHSEAMETTAKEFAVMRKAELDKLKDRINSLSDDVQARVTYVGHALNIDGIFVGDDERALECLADTLEPVYTNIIAKAANAIGDLAKTLRTVDDNVLIDALNDSIKLFPRIEGRSGTLTTPCEHVVSAISSGMLIGEKEIVQYASDAVFSGSITDVMTSFRYTHALRLLGNEVSNGDAQPMLVPSKDTLHTILDNAYKLIILAERFSSSASLTNLCDEVEEATKQDSEEKLDPYRRKLVTSTAEAIIDFTCDTARHVASVVAALVTYLTSCVESSEEAQAIAKAQEISE